MYDKYRYNKFKHVAATLLYAAILLAGAGEFFVSNSHEITSGNGVQTQYEREIPEHLPEKYENSVLKALKIGKQKATSITKDNHSEDLVGVIESIFGVGIARNPSEVNHKFIS